MYTYIIITGDEINAMEFQWNIITKRQTSEIKMISVYIGFRVSFVCDFRTIYCFLLVFRLLPLNL